MSVLLNSITMEYLQIPSEITYEKPFCDHLEERFTKTATHLQCERLNHNLVLSHLQKPSCPTLAWVGHIDTVAAQEDGEPRESEGYLHGCGASDMKGGLAVMTALLEDKALIESTPANFVFVFYEQEEGPYDGNGLQPVLEQFECLSKVDLAFALEPTNNTIQNGCVGGLHARLYFEGRRAHSARPWQGENAIHKAGTLLVELSQLERVEASFGALKFYEVINATLAEGGKVRNAIPEQFIINLNYRFAPGKALEQAKQELLELVNGRARVEFVDEAPSGPCYQNNPYLNQFLEVTGVAQEAKQAWTDVARLALFDIPAVNFGPGDTAQAHQKNEIISKLSLEENYQYFLQYLGKL